jgi:integrase
VPDASAKAGYRSVYAATQREVLAKARDARTAPLTSREPLAEVLDRWLAVQVQRRRRPKTYGTYRTLVKHQIAPHLGGVAVGALTPQRVDRWLRELEGSSLAPRTVATAHRCLKSALSWAVRQEIVPRNVAALVEGVSIPHTEIPPLTAGQVRQLLALLAGDRYAGPLLSCLLLGLRIGEACGLTWADVDLDAGIVQLRRQLQFESGRGCVLGPLKTAQSRRALALPTLLAELIAARPVAEAVDRARMGIKWRRQYDSWGLVWRTPLGSACYPDAVRKRFTRHATALGRPDLTPHALRHQHASILFAAGLNVKRVSEQLGHSTQAITADVYIHLLPQAAQEVPALVERWLDES